MRKIVNVVAASLAGLLAGGLLVAAVAKVRESAVRSSCSNNLRQIGASLELYHEANRSFPQAAIPNPRLAPERRLSWLVRLGPYFYSTDLYSRLDREKGWDAEENRYLALTVESMLQCPNQPDRPPVSTLAPTNYVGLAGLGTDAVAAPPADRGVGFFGYDRKLGLGDIRKPASGLLVAVETARVGGAWTAAGPATVRGLEDEAPPCLGDDRPFGGMHHGGANALFADASVRFLQDSLDPRAFRAMATIQGGEE